MLEILLLLLRLRRCMLHATEIMECDRRLIDVVEVLDIEAMRALGSVAARDRSTVFRLQHACCIELAFLRITVVRKVCASLRKLSELMKRNRLLQ